MRKQKSRFLKRSFLFSIVILFPCISLGQDSIFTVYYDPLKLGNVGFKTPFYLERIGHFLDASSAEWTIDDTIKVIIGSGYNSNYTGSGAYMTIEGLTAQKLFSDGIHMVKLTAEYDDSTITKSWYFRFREVEYKMFKATIVNYQNLTDNKYYYYNVLKAEPMDTSEFCCTCTSSDTFINYDTTGICNQSRYDIYMSSRINSDTINCFVLQQITAPGVCDISIISQPVDSFLSVRKKLPDTLKFPFSLSKALTYFNIYINENSVKKAYTQIPGPLKLGPLMDLQYLNPGDPGWELSAEYDNNLWYFTHRVGGGDCPCGCTEWKSFSYTISQNEILRDAVINSPNKRIPKINVRSKQTGYDLLGRMLQLDHKATLSNGLIIEKSNGLREKKIKIRN